MNGLSSFDGTTFLRAVVPAKSGGLGASYLIIGRFADGSFLTRPRGVGFFPSATGVVRLPESYGRYDPESGAVSQVANDHSMEWAAGDRGRYTRAFGKEDIPVARDDRLVVGDNGAAAMQIYDLQGRLDRIVRWSSDAMPVTQEDRSRYVEYMREEPPRFPLSTDLDFPEERPYFSAIAADELNWIWVEQYAAE